jgi:hypothetical protein
VGAELLHEALLLFDGQTHGDSFRGIPPQSPGPQSSYYRSVEAGSREVFG